LYLVLVIRILVIIWLLVDWDLVILFSLGRP